MKYQCLCGIEKELSRVRHFIKDGKLVSDAICECNRYRNVWVY